MQLLNLIETVKIKTYYKIRVVFFILYEYIAIYNIVLPTTSIKY